MYKIPPKCGRCVNKDTSKCDKCIDHPKWQNRPIKSYFELYRVVCPYKFKDCVNDPAYIKFYHPDLYEDLYGEMNTREAAKFGCDKCIDGSHYDDEDK